MNQNSMEDGIKIRQAKIEDLPEMLQIYKVARKFMENTGNPNQWGNVYPKESVLIEDINNKNSYVIENENGICGTFYFNIGNDKTYARIENGSWLNDLPYGTIHRIAGNGFQRGVVKLAVEFVSSIYKECFGKNIVNLRIDTHEDNKVMQHVLEKAGFKKCGIIYTEEGAPRIAYQKYE